MERMKAEPAIEKQHRDLLAEQRTTCAMTPHPA
jgi:hypothetical protein